MAYKFQLGDARMSGSLTQEEGVTVDSGGLTVTAGGATVTAGGLTVTAGTTAVAAVTCTTLSATGDVDLGNAGTDTISATGQFDTDLVPSTDSARDLGTSTKQWAEAHVDTGYIDDITSTGTITTAALTATANLDIGAYSLRATQFTSDIADGTAPFVVTSTTQVANLNASTLGGADFASPGAIGGTAASAGTFAALVGTSLSVSDGDITNVGDINCDSVSVDDAAAGLNINFGGSSTGNNKLSLTDNLADALNITEAGNSYMKFTTTDASELITFGKNSTFSGTTIANLGTVSACTSLTATDLVGTNIDGIIGADTARAGTFDTLVAEGNVDLGNATSDTITATGRFDSDLTPSSDSARNLGSSALRWSTIYVDSIVGADVAFDVETVAGGGTISAGTDFALVSSGDGTTVTLPDASAGKALRVKLGNSVGDSILDANGADTIDGATTIRLESTGSAVTLVAYDASTWYII